MKSIYNIFKESILGDMEDTLGRMDVDVMEISFNKPDSKLRELFSINAKEKTPFSVSGHEGNITLTVNDSDTFAKVSSLKDPISNNLSSHIPGLQKLIVKTPLLIKGDGSKLNNTNFCSDILAHSLTVGGIISIDKINMVVSDLEAGWASSMIFDETLESISNCKLENNVNNMLTLHSIPTFKNVHSDTITYINIGRDTLAPTKFWDKQWVNSIFEYGYDVRYSSTIDGTISVKSFNDIKKIISAKDHYKRTYLDSPIRIRPGAKVSDIIDISKFNNIQRIYIHDNKMAIILVKKTYSMLDKVLKSFWSTSIHADKLDANNPQELIAIKTYFLNSTSDGWYVLVSRA